MLLINQGTLTRNLRIIFKASEFFSIAFQAAIPNQWEYMWLIKQIYFTGQATCPFLVFLPAPSTDLNPSFRCSQNNEIKLQWFLSCSLYKFMLPWGLQSCWIVLSRLNNLNAVVTQHVVQDCSEKSENQVNKGTEQITKHLWDSPLCTELGNVQHE